MSIVAACVLLPGLSVRCARVSMQPDAHAGTRTDVLATLPAMNGRPLLSTEKGRSLLPAEKGRSLLPAAKER